MNPIFFIAAASALAVIFVVSTIENKRHTASPPVTEVTVPAPQQEISKPSDAGGFGMSYGGRVGVDMGGGMVLTSKGIEFGFGF